MTTIKRIGKHIFKRYGRYCQVCGYSRSRATMSPNYCYILGKGIDNTVLVALVESDQGDDDQGD